MNMIVILEPFLFYSLPISLMRVSTHVALTNYVCNFSSPYRFNFFPEDNFKICRWSADGKQKLSLETYHKCNINLTSRRRQCRGAIFLMGHLLHCALFLSCTFVHMLRNKFIFADALGAAKTMSKGEQS